MSYHPPPMLKMHLAEVSCQLARLFISAGADPDAVNKDGRTPMMVAILQVCYFSFYNNSDFSQCRPWKRRGDGGICFSLFLARYFPSNRNGQ